MSFMNTNLRAYGLAALRLAAFQVTIRSRMISLRTERVDTIVPVEFCSEFSDASGFSVIAVLTPLDQNKYLLMQADVKMADIDSSPTIKIIVTPLSVAENFVIAIERKRYRSTLTAPSYSIWQCGRHG